MKDTIAARRYAGALFLAIQSEGKTPLDQVQKELKLILQLTRTDAELSGVLAHALLSAEKKRAVLASALGFTGKKYSLLSVNFVNLLINKKRMDLLPLILADFESLVDESNNTVKAQVKSAQALDDKAKREMEQKLSKLFDKRVLIENSVHPELLAGVVVKAGDTVIDNSLATQLKNMRQRFEHGY